MTLTDFLLARIAEDEAVASRDVAPIFDGSAFFWLDDEPSFPALIADPARVLAECEAKRRIVEKALEQPPTGSNLTDYMRGIWAARHAALYDLAAVYADHTDFQEGWAL